MTVFGWAAITDGPCAKCGATCTRYGPDGSPWCKPECIPGAPQWRRHQTGVSLNVPDGARA